MVVGATLNLTGLAPRGCWIDHLQFSAASHKVPRSLTAQSLDELRRRLLVLILGRRGRRDRPITVQLDLDVAAQAERNRRTRNPKEAIFSHTSAETTAPLVR